MTLRTSQEQEKSPQADGWSFKTFSSCVSRYGKEKEEDFQGFLSAYRLFCFVSGFKMFKQVVIGSCGGLTRFNGEVHPTWLLSSKVSTQEKHDHTVTPSNCFYTVTLQFTLSNSLCPHFIFSKQSKPKLLKYFSSGGICIFWITQQLLKSNHGDRLPMACWAITSCFMHPFSLFLFLDIFLTTLPNILLGNIPSDTQKFQLNHQSGVQSKMNRKNDVHISKRNS